MKNLIVNFKNMLAKKGSMIAVFAIFCFMPFLAMAQSVIDTVTQTATEYAVFLAGGLVFVITNFVKKQIDVDSKLGNAIIWILSAVCIATAWGMAGAPAIGYKDFFAYSALFFAIGKIFKTSVQAPTV